MDTFERVSLNEFNDTHQSKLMAGELALIIESDQSIDELPEGYEKAAYIAINFPAFTDGRGYTLARELKNDKGYQGEIRAIGEVLHDQLHAMERCGFSAYELLDGKDAEKALKAFDDFTQKYQADTLEQKPIYSR